MKKEKILNETDFKSAMKKFILRFSTNDAAHEYILQHDIDGLEIDGGERCCFIDMPGSYWLRRGINASKVPKA